MIREDPGGGAARLPDVRQAPIDLVLEVVPLERAHEHVEGERLAETFG